MSFEESSKSEFKDDKTSNVELIHQPKSYTRQWANLDKIEENLYLGDITTASNLFVMKELKIKRVLSLISMPIDSHHKLEGVNYKFIFAEDGQNFDLLTHFPECIEYITDGQNSGQPVYVHCKAGISRSSTVVIAFLMSKYKMTYAEALKLVKAKRCVRPNEGFDQQLLLFEEMKFKLDANNRKLRRYLVRNSIMYLEHTLNSVFFRTTIDCYFQKLSLAESTTENLYLGQVFECVKCDYGLFNEINIIENDRIRAKQTDDECSLVFIEPQKWMSQPFEKRNVAELEEGVVKCPQCSETIGKFDFYLGTFNCSCPLHIRLDCLFVRIFNDKFRIQDNTDL